jgi:HD-like signal output (HDOD) protein
MGEHPLLRRLRSARELPTLPAALIPLLKHLERPQDQQDVHEIVRLIAQDKSLAARSLQLANSPLYGACHDIESIQGAVIALGLTRIQEIALSCSMLQIVPSLWFEMSPAAFWAHSMGCAIIARELALKVGFPDEAKAYAAGLLHDLGIVGLLWAAPEEFRRAIRAAQLLHISLNDAEQRELGMTHAEAGRVVGESWNLPAELVEVIAFHHEAQKAPHNPALVSIVSVSDLICRTHGMGYGFPEERDSDVMEEADFKALAAHFPSLHASDCAEFSSEMEAIVEEAFETVGQVYGTGL